MLAVKIEPDKGSYLGVNVQYGRSQCTLHVPDAERRGMMKGHGSGTTFCVNDFAEKTFPVLQLMLVPATDHHCCATLCMHCCSCSFVQEIHLCNAEAHKSLITIESKFKVKTSFIFSNYSAIFIGSFFYSI